MRLAGTTLVNFLKNNSWAKDVAETAGMAGLGVAYQATQTDMEDADIVKAALVGAGLGMAARPLGREAGFIAGRAADKHAPQLVNAVKPYLPVTTEGRANLDQAVNRFGGVGRFFGDIADMNQNQVKFVKDKLGNVIRERSDGEAMLGYYGGNRADNIVQGLAAIAAPGLLGIDDEQS